MYLELSTAELKRKAEELEEVAARCGLCPRGCRARRREGERGFCRAGWRPWVSSYGPHFGEERELVGRGGSGTIFLTGCNLRCVFCQNFEISQLHEGREVSVAELARMMLELQLIGCHNVNFVTPTHQAHAIVKALLVARDHGLRLPVVWNCGGYESVEVLRILEGVVDIYMPDFKYGDSRVAEKYSAAPRYFEVAKEALKEMHRQVGDLVVEGGVAVRGLIVRHLVLPHGLAGTEKVLRFIAEEISKDTYVNVMAQYYPTWKAHRHPELSRRINTAEFHEALELARKLGLNRAGPH